MKKNAQSRQQCHACRKKLQLVMKISTLLLLIVLHVSAKNYAQEKVTLNFKGASLIVVLKSIEKQSSYRFFYSDDIVPASKTLTIGVKNANINEVMDLMLEGLPLNWKMIEGNRIIITASTKNVEAPSIFSQSGTIKNEKGEPLQGATITEKGTNNLTLSDANGNFKLKVKDADAVLQINFTGYAKQEIKYTGKPVVISLVPSANELDDIVVVGYGTVRKKDLTGAVEKVNMKDLQKAPVRSLDEALGGRVAGVQVVSSDGQPGSPTAIVIRGNNSITQDNSPLFVIDGFPSESPDLNSINVSDIESIEVLKDASATAIYGARAANGVVMITTKQGKMGKTEVSYNSYIGVQKVIKKMDLLSPYEFVRFQFENDSINTKAQYLTGGKTIDSYKDAVGVDWQDILFRNAKMVNNEIAIRGGNANTKFSLSASALQQDGIILFSGYNRYQGRFRLDHSINEKLKIGLNVNYSALKAYGTVPSTLTNSSSETSNLMFSIWGYRPVAGNASVDLTVGLDPYFELDQNDSRFNPLETVTYEVRNRFNNSIISNLSLEYKILNNLLFKTTLGYTNDVARNEEFNSTQTRAGSPLTASGRISGVNGSIVNNTKNSYLNENTISYNKRFKNHHTIDAVAGLTLQGLSQNIFGAAATNLPNEKLGLSGLDEGTPSKISSYRSSNSLASYLLRVNYSYDSKYLLTVSMRSDGSSKFSPENKWSYFPSGSFAWRFSNEKFMKDVSVVNDAKLRFSYGLIGNNRVSDFAYLNTLASSLTLAYPFNGVASTSIVPDALGNPNLKWETTSQANLGLDVSLIKSRITLGIDLYRKVTTDLLLYAQLPPSSGFTRGYKNIGKVENKGLEFTINTKNIDTKKFTWSSSFNISFNRNKVLALNDNQESLLTTINWDNQWRGIPAYIAKVGQPLGLMYGAVWLGNYQYDDFDKSSSGIYTLKPTVSSNTTVADPKIQPGYIKYKDLNGDRIINDNDMTVIGNPNPDFIGGFTNNFKYKNFDVNIFLQFSYGGDVLNANRLVFEGNSGRTLQNQFETVANRWTPTNQNNDMYVAKGDGGRVYSSRVIEDGSYLRLKTLQVGYTLPQSILKKIKIKSIRFYLSGQNLLTWTKYTGLDPEVSAYNSALTPAFDYSVYPRATTLTFGLNVNF